jgi:hypothetical protein
MPCFLSCRRKKRRKKTGFTVHTLSDRAPHRGFQLERARSKPSYQLELSRQRENH